MALCHSQVTLMLSTDINIQKPHIPASFNMYLVISKCVTAVKVSNFSGHYLRNRSTLDIGVLDYIGIVQHKEHSPEVLSIPPGTPYIIMCKWCNIATVCSSGFIMWINEHRAIEADSQVMNVMWSHYNLKYSLLIALVYNNSWTRSASRWFICFFFDSSSEMPSR